VPFSFKKKPITELLERFAPLGTNLLYPQKAADLEMLKQQYVTYLPHEKKISRATAWSTLKTLLELSGFSIFPQKNSFTIVRNATIDGGAINREPLPIFAGTIEDIPQDDGRIIYIHYLKNLKVPEPQEKDTHPLSLMLKQLLTYNASLLYDARSNAIIIIDKAFHAAYVARLLKEFDEKGFKEEVAYLPITYLPAQELVNIFDSLRMAADTDTLRTFIRSDPAADAFTYLSQDTRVVSDPQRNGIILMGRKNNIERIIGLIKDLLDVPQDKGDSVLHYYDLNYLDSMQIAPILNRIVAASLPSGEQATTESAKPLFPGVVIAALESTIQKPSLATEDIAIEQKGFQEVEKLDYAATNVGNRLLIAARANDWQIIKKLIQQLDTPQPQVLLEVLVVEFAYDNTTNLSGTIRNLTDSPVLPQGVEFLASHITPVVSVLGTTPTQLAVDLLQIIGPGDIPSQIPSGSMLISLNDPKTPGIFGLLEILNKVVSARINSYPYVTTKNHKEGLLDSTTMIRTTGDLSTTAGGTATIPIVNLPATFAVNIVPHIVSDSRLRLVIGFTDDRFTDPANLTRRTQELRTTATLNSGEILVMGGLLRVDNIDKGSYTPILGHVPIFGSFFRGTQAQTITTNVTLFVMPTILEPRSRWIAKTNDYICDNKSFVTRAEIPAMLRDPIYRLHFRDTSDQQVVDQFIAQGTHRYRCHELKLMQSLPDESPPAYDPLALKQILGRKKLCVPPPPRP
jgi:general secretion pathway protein D